MGRSADMFTLLLLFLFVAIFAKRIGAGGDKCPRVWCGHHGPAIRFPFRLKDRQPDHCGYPGFDLYCNQKNQTVLELPSSVELLVKKINYKSHEIHVYDQDDCLPRQLGYLNLSASPFQFKKSHNYRVDFALFNCSGTDVFLGEYLIPCLGVPGYHVFAVNSDYPSLWVPLLSCSKIYDISLETYDMLYQKYVPLNWSSSICRNCEAAGMNCRLKKNNSTDPETECSGEPAKAKEEGEQLNTRRTYLDLVHHHL